MRSISISPIRAPRLIGVVNRPLIAKRFNSRVCFAIRNNRAATAGVGWRCALVDNYSGRYSNADDVSEIHLATITPLGSLGYRKKGWAVVVGCTLYTPSRLYPHQKKAHPLFKSESPKFFKRKMMPEWSGSGLENRRCRKAWGSIPPSCATAHSSFPPHKI